MAGSLQDQLLKAGVANKQQAKKASIEKRKQKKQAPDQLEREKQARAEEIKLRQAQKAEQDRALNAERERLNQEKAINAQIKQLIERHQIRISQEAETRFQFVDGSTIKSIWIDQEHLTPLSRAQIRVARQGEGYALLPAAIAERIIERRGDIILPLAEDQQQSDEDDPYADYPIPDDLMW